MNRPRVAMLLGFVGVALLGIVLAVALSDDADDRRVTDVTGTISVEVPRGWGDVRLDPRRREGADVFRIEAAPDLDAFEARRDAPGMEFSYTDGLTRAEIIRQLDVLADRMGAPARCAEHGRRTFAHRGFTGTADEYEGCGTDDARISLIAAVPPDGRGLAILAVQAATEEQRRLILDTFTVHDPQP